MKKTCLALSMFVVLAAGAAPVLSQQNHGTHHPPGATQSAAMAEGEVRKIDKDAKKITLRHGEIKSLEMPPMTLVFQVKDPVMLDKLQAGDKVRFKAEKVGGAYTVTVIEAVK
jgi:Cu/Ag efflux protein CusF